MLKHSGRQAWKKTPSKESASTQTIFQDSNLVNKMFRLTRFGRHRPYHLGKMFNKLQRG